MMKTKSSVIHDASVLTQRQRPPSSRPWVFAVFQYFRNIFTLINSLWYVLQENENIMGYSAAGGPWRHPKWPPRWLPSLIFLKLQLYGKIRKWQIFFSRDVKYIIITDFAAFQRFVYDV